MGLDVDGSRPFVKHQHHIFGVYNGDRTEVLLNAYSSIRIVLFHVKEEKEAVAPDWGRRAIKGENSGWHWVSSV